MSCFFYYSLSLSPLQLIQVQIRRERAIELGVELYSYLFQCINGGLAWLGDDGVNQEEALEEKKKKRRRDEEAGEGRRRRRNKQGGEGAQGQALHHPPLRRHAPLLA
uniref:Uncharacterized protein n=1 Tax=Oryza barthii TaxID=65489 RepID=A0A0D3EPN5_9ORYZ